MKYFNNIKDLNTLKQEFKQLAKKLHPDVGGDAEEFKKMVCEFEDLFHNLKDEKNKDTPSNLINLFNKITFLFNYEGATIEIVGSWCWISFDKKPETSIIDRLKLAGLRWSMKNKKWFSGGENFKYKPIKTRLKFDDIVARYGSDIVNNFEPKLAIN